MAKRYELDKNKDKIIDLYINKKMSCNDISKKLGYSLCGIYDALRRWNVKTRNLRESHIIYECDETFFYNIDSEEKAYWLGFIYADGYITGNKLGIALAMRDIEHLEKFKKCIKATYPINTYMSNSNYKSIEYCRILINSPKLIRDIKSKGVVYNKSPIIKYPNKDMLDEIYYRHFIRGYFDGDGSLVLSKNSINFKICGTKEFLEKLIEVFNSCSKYSFKNVLFKRKKDNKNNYYLSFGGRYKTLSVMNYLYDKSEVYLDRKYKKFILLKSM